MKIHTLILIFSSFANIAFCQKQYDRFDGAIGLLSGKSCYLSIGRSEDNYSMWSFTDSTDYFTFSEKAFSYPTLKIKGQRCLQLTQQTHVADPISNTMRLIGMSCPLILCFTNKVNNENKYEIIMQSENVGKTKGSLSFISDSLFLLQPGLTSPREYYRVILPPTGVSK